MKNEAGEFKCYTVGVVRPEHLCRSVWLKKKFALKFSLTNITWYLKIFGWLMMLSAATILGFISSSQNLNISLHLTLGWETRLKPIPNSDQDQILSTSLDLTSDYLASPSILSFSGFLHPVYLSGLSLKPSVTSLSLRITSFIIFLVLSSLVFFQKILR